MNAIRRPGEGLTEVPRDLFDHADTLELLDLSSNALTALPADFGRFTALRYLILSANQFTEVPRVLADCPNLGLVALKSNGLTHFPEGALPPSVHWLTLTDNRLERLPESLGHCRGLRKVGLTGNRLDRLPTSLEGCRDLELLRLSANRFERLPGWLAELPDLRWLAFSANPLAPRPPALPVLAPVAWADLTLETVLGQGASGVVHRAKTRTGNQELVAVKVFKGEMTSDGSPEDERAACVAAGDHPHLVPVLGEVLDHPEGRQALVQALIPPSYRILGQTPTLASCTRDVYPPGSNLSLTQAGAILKGVRSALDRLHSRGLLHGDLYAHNILVNPEGHAFLTDFGAATFFDPGSSEAPRLRALDDRAFALLEQELLALTAPQPPADS